MIYLLRYFFQPIAGVMLGCLATAAFAKNAKFDDGSILADEGSYDLVVYGDSSGAVTAAVAAKRKGLSVILINPTGFLGGMSASGLGATDFLGQRIASITMLSGKTFHGKMFIDATYVGDLMAAAGVSYTVGREPESQYGENLAGVRRGDTKPRAHYGQGDKDHFVAKVDGYVIPGDSSSGLLPHIHKIEGLKNGQGDRKIQGYNYRMCLTKDPALKIPLEKPEGYREIDHELLLRNFEAGDRRMPALIEPLAGSGSKVDWNNMHAVGSDYVGANWEYPEASYAKRREIEKEHQLYIRGFLWTLANKERVPEHIRKRAAGRI